MTDSPITITQPPWFQGKPIRFKCTGCGKCCVQKDKWTPLMAEDIRRLQANGFQVADIMHEQDMFKDPNGIPYQVLNKKPDSDECTFYDSKTKGCNIHAIRPAICRMYPFSAHLLDTEERWNQEAREVCEGIGQGPWYAPNMIKEIMHMEGSAPGVDTTTDGT